MATARKRATIYFDQALYRALRQKAAEVRSSVSRVANDAISEVLAKDAEDVAAIETRRNESDLDSEAVVKRMKRRGRLSCPH